MRRCDYEELVGGAWPHLVRQLLHGITQLDHFVAVDATHPAVDAVHSSSAQEATGLTLLHISQVIGVPGTAEAATAQHSTEKPSLKEAEQNRQAAGSSLARSPSQQHVVQCPASRL